MQACIVDLIRESCWRIRMRLWYSNFKPSQLCYLSTNFIYPKSLTPGHQCHSLYGYLNLFKSFSLHCACALLDFRPWHLPVHAIESNVSIWCSWLFIKLELFPVFKVDWLSHSLKLTTSLSRCYFWGILRKPFFFLLGHSLNLLLLGCFDPNWDQFDLRLRKKQLEFGQHKADKVMHQSHLLWLWVRCQHFWCNIPRGFWRKFLLLLHWTR